LSSDTEPALVLIINADDFGRDGRATDRALTCFGQSRISSTTAMVFMADSERASRIAPSRLSVGLHVNFSEAFTGPNVPEPLRTAHARVARFLKRNKHALLLFHPLLSADFRNCFAAQCTEFERLYGRTPTHFDGHQHLHLATNVLVSRILPRGARVRRSFTFFAGEKDPFNRAYRTLVDRSLAKRHVITDYFFSIAHYLDPQRLERLIVLSKSANVELMTHPVLDPEFEFLTSDNFADAIKRTTLGSFAELRQAA
jgi:predicted glycoside hydrolase/deacetylase ChbG (UPF0249 family)